MEIQIDLGKKIAIIPARGGSKGVPQKNIKLLKGYPLIAYSIVLAKNARQIDRVIVSTDSEEIAEIANSYGAEVPFIRPKEYALDQSGDIEFVSHALQWFSEKEGSIPEYLIHLRPTTPLRSEKVVDRAIEEIINCPTATSLRSAHAASESPYKWFLKDKRGCFVSVVSELTVDNANEGRQGFPEVFIPDGYVDVLKSQFIMENQLLHGNHMLAFESPVCYEIDTADDFDFIEYQIQKYGSQIYEKLLEENLIKRGK